MSHNADPIFVIGSYRSGTSVLTWCLGQHRNILPLEETNWISRLSVHIDYLFHLGTTNNLHSHLSATGIKRRDFNNSFGEFVNNFLEKHKEQLISKSLSLPKEYFNENYSHRRSPNDPKRRWIDGTPENSHYVYGLNKMFPKAKFIHILRNPSNVARSLMHFSTAGARDYEEEEAYATWLRLTKDSIDAEKAFGSNKVLRIYYEDFIKNPTEVLSKCLDFVGEAFDSNCLLPLSTKINSSSYSGDDQYGASNHIPVVKTEALDFYSSIISENEHFDKPSLSTYRYIRAKFKNYAKSQTPEEIDKMSQWASNLQIENNQKENQIIALEKELQQYRPLVIKDYGPKEIYANQPFNLQENGENAIWIITENATKSTVISLNGQKLPAYIQTDGKLVTAVIPKEQTLLEGKYNLHLFDSRTGVVSNDIQLIVYPV